VKVPFRVHRCRGRDAAVAAFLDGPDMAALLGLCSSLGLDPSGRVFAAGDGLLLILAAATDRPLPGAIRLRALAPNLFLPVDAELVPSLLDDEAAGLVRDRGLVFLPGGRVIGFDPCAPLPGSSLLTARMIPPRDWQALPVRPPLAERIEEILVDRPEDSPEAILDAAGGDQIGTEPDRPTTADPGAGTSPLGTALSEAGRAVEGLGDRLGSTLLARLGAALHDLAAPAAPRNVDDLIRRQAAALRHLLHEFREGSIEQALKRSLPLPEPGDGRGAGVFTGDRLHARNLDYNLNDLLGGGESSGSRWLGGGELLEELLREYRKAAEAAMRQGDYRRAAAIYGKLLRDYRAAAHALLRGGLHHDAGVLLLSRLDDRRGAARAFESAGEVDRAVELYRSVGAHEAAGDLLRRIGEEEAALTEYRTAAGRLAASEAGYLAAGLLLLEKAGRPDLALEQFAAGWSRRPLANSVACAVQMARLHAETGDGAGLRRLADEADAHFETFSSQVEPGLFYNELAGLAERPALETEREDLRDRALMGLAAQIRRLARPGEKAGKYVSELLGRHSWWPAATVSDANHAVAEATRPRPEASPSSRKAPHASRFWVGAGLVRAVCAADVSGEVFVGLERGDVYGYRPGRSEVISVAAHDLPVAALAASTDGSHLVILRAHPSGRGAISSYARQPDGCYRLLLGMSLGDLTEPWLTSILTTEVESLVGFWDGRLLHLLAVASLTSWGSLPLSGPESPPAGALLLNSDHGEEGEFTVLAHDGRQWSSFDPWGGVRHPTRMKWRPALSHGSPLRSPLLSWSGRAPGDLELCGIGERGSIQWGMFRDGVLASQNSTWGVDEPGYRAATIVRHGLVAGVATSRIEWLRCGNSKFHLWRSTDLDLSSAVACFAARQTDELIVICKDGMIVRVPIPV
jgi:tetratricopeptide (TPR) repeat protein